MKKKERTTKTTKEEEHDENENKEAIFINKKIVANMLLASVENVV